ncbi:MAG: TIR domain-containing protein [Rickettsiales bacterium]|nr:TIR domain-containing protein [Rickettsiales bacterium]
MKSLEKINLVRNIVNEIESKNYSYDEKIFILETNSIQLHHHDDYNSSVDFNNSFLKASDKSLRDIAEELSISSNLSGFRNNFPKSWINTNDLKIFISHSSKDRNSANNLREALKPYKINCFVAHQDITPSSEWEVEIEKALDTMDCFISLITADFNQSVWCQQEFGYAMSRKIHIIPISLKGITPDGFAKKIQYAPALKLEEMTSLIIKTIRDSRKIGELYNQINPLKPKDDEIPF